MKTVKITRLSGENFKGSGKIDLQLGGGSVALCGPNGSGKTTHFDLYTWLICNRMSSGKTADVSNVNGGDTVTGEVAFDNGLTFRRESTGKYFVNDVPTPCADYFKQIDAMTGGGVKCLAMPFNFCNLDWKERRDILNNMAGDISTDEVIAADSSLEVIREQLQTLTTEQIKKQATTRRKKYADELAAIPARIDELKRRPTVDFDRNLLEADIAATEGRIAELEGEIANAKQPDALRQSIADISNGIATLKSQIAAEESSLKILRENYRKTTIAFKGHCPFCGAPISADKKSAIKKQLDEITADGQKCAASLEVKRRALKAGEEKLAELRTAPTTATNIQELLSELKGAQKRLGDEHRKLDELRTQEINRRRIDELLSREKELGKIVSNYDAIIAAADTFNQTYATLTEQKINSLFQVVKFKLFAKLKTQEHLKPCCEVTVDGVPYEMLSTGEKFKAALDILRALQNFYQVKMPLWIDEANSYTSNSYLELPDQQYIFLYASDVPELRVERIVDNAN